MARLGDIINYEGKEYFVISDREGRYIVFPQGRNEATMLMKKGQAAEVTGHMTAQEWFK